MKLIESDLKPEKEIKPVNEVKPVPKLEESQPKVVPIIPPTIPEKEEQPLIL